MKKKNRSNNKGADTLPTQNGILVAMQ